MKKLYFIFCQVLVINYCAGQTNTFPASGNVGIGTTNPDASLVIKSDHQQIKLGTGTNTSGYTFTIGANDDGVNFENNSGLRGFNFKNIQGTLLSITSGGSVGIGTPVPQSKLSVNGTVTAKQVKVTQTGWPDYVFDSAYILPSLSSITAFIKAEHHLPDIPSTKEIESRGLDLGDMQKKQMQKIEELILYIININKKQQAMELQVKQLAAANKKLNAQIRKLKAELK